MGEEKPRDIADLLFDLLNKSKGKPPPARKSAPREPQKNLFSNLFGTALLANKWKQAISEERQTKIMEHFTIPRDEVCDVYKPNSWVETQTIIEHPPKKPITEETAEMLQEVAANYDYCCSLDIIDALRPHTFVSNDSQEQLDRLPTWLRFLVICKYDLIHERYGHFTHHFLRLLANRVDGRRTTNLEAFEPLNDEDFQDEYEIKQKFDLTKKDVMEISKAVNHPDKLFHPKKETLTVEEERKEALMSSDLFKLRNAVNKWRLPRSLEQDWAPSGIHRAAVILRRALMTQPAPAEVAMVAEDERIRKNESAISQYDFDEEDADSSSDKNHRPSWEDMVVDKAGFRDEVGLFVDDDLHKIPTGLTKHEKEEEIRLAEEVAKKTNRKGPAQKKLWARLKNHELFRKRREKKQRKVSLQDRSSFRRYSRIWQKNCPQEPVKQAKRLPHHYRFDESFHSYVVTLVGSKLFKNFIMFVIIANALLLAAETSEGTKEAEWISDLFSILDNLFLSVYLVEFVLKVYAHPYRYWTSGFNIFDAIILIVSLVKAIVDWIGTHDISFLKVLVIVRALRILRGISMSIQIQVLITALVETLKTHVLSVLILLFLLMYIASIIAFYFFADTPGLEEPWNNILDGMLRLFSFVTMDGWTDTSEQFEKAGKTEEGRFFCLVCILLGNFLISNIFIAIIIMQISEATDAFRSRQRDEREEIITLKKEIVFRRQKLDMRQLLAKQNMTSNADFYYLGSQFLKLLRHDDLVDMNDVPFSPLWMDAFYKTIHRCHHTANLLMNLHRQMADGLVEMYEKNNASRYTVTPIRRSRYNRYMKLKAKLSLLRQEFYRDELHTGFAKANRPLRVRFDAWTESKKNSGGKNPPPPGPPNSGRPSIFPHHHDHKDHKDHKDGHVKWPEEKRKSDADKGQEKRASLTDKQDVKPHQEKRASLTDKQGQEKRPSDADKGPDKKTNEKK